MGASSGLLSPPHHRNSNSAQNQPADSQQATSPAGERANETMKPIFQTKLLPPDGNCFIACLASILECEIDELPDLSDIEASGENWLIGLNVRLKPMGYGVTYMQASEEKPAEVFIPKGCHFIVSGLGASGVPHSIVMRQGDMPEIAHDPAGGNGKGLKEIRSFQVVVKL